VAAGVSRPATALRAVFRFTGGLFLLAAGGVLLVPLSLQVRTFTVLETWTVLTGLLVEQLIGADFRGRNPNSN
jgi:hypothetical protein